MKHKHADVIKAWADGVPCQFETEDGAWFDWMPLASWMNFRVKPSTTSDEQTDNHSGICLEVEA